MPNPTFSQIYDEVTGTTYDIKSITDTSLSEAGTPADAASVKRELNGIRENTKNVFDVSWFSAPGVVVKDGTATGKANAFNSAFKEANGGIPLDCKENTQYTFSGKAKTDGMAGTSGNGILMRIYYSDGTFTQVVLANGWSSDHDFSATTDAGKTIDHLSMAYVSAGDNVWSISNVQLEEGTQKTDYTTYYTSVDRVARGVSESADSKAEDAQKIATFVKSRLQIRLIWENGTINGSGKDQTDSKNMRTGEIIHIQKGSKIWKTSNTIAVTAIFYSHNDLNTQSGSRQILPLAKTDAYVFEEDAYCRFVLQNPNGLTRTSSWANTVVETDLYDADFANHEIGVEIAILGFSAYLGNALVFRLPDGRLFGIDSFIAAAYNSVKAIYTDMGISHFDYFMISHYHLDHVGNIISMIEDGYIDADTIMILPPDLDTSYETQIFTDWLNDDGPKAMYQVVRPAIEELGCTVIHPTEGQVLSISGVDIKFFNCEHSIYYPGGSYATTNYNDLSLGCYVTIGNYNFCDTADIGPVAQQRMVDLNVMKKANVYTATHHGWDNGIAANYYGLIPAWINRLSPDVVISEDCAALDPRIMTKGAPMQSWCEANGIPNYRSRINGTMYIQLNKYGWKFKGNYSRFIRNNKNWSYSDNSEHVEE